MEKASKSPQAREKSKDSKRPAKAAPSSARAKTRASSTRGRSGGAVAEAAERRKPASTAERAERRKPAAAAEAAEAAERRKPAAPKKSDKQRKRTKNKAEKLFLKQYGGDGLGGSKGTSGASASSGASGSSGDGAPRAAFYKVSMGSSHKKASKMQSAKRPGAGAGFSVSVPVPTASDAKNLAGTALARSNVTPRAIRISTLILCVVISCVFMYGPTKDYYHALRENDRLVAEYETIQSRNAAIDDQNNMITSDAGLEDSVRQKYGYVKRGESKGVVLGLSEDTTSTLRESDSIEANVLSSTVKAPVAWYTPYLDALFGVE